MVDPLSVLGAAVGVTSLIIQITDECIKGLPDPNLRSRCSRPVGFKFYSEATNMPKTYRYLRGRSQIEQQRFLNFALEASIWFADGVICADLQVNRLCF